MDWLALFVHGYALHGNAAPGAMPHLVFGFASSALFSVRNKELARLTFQGALRSPGELCTCTCAGLYQRAERISSFFSRQALVPCACGLLCFREVHTCIIFGCFHLLFNCLGRDCTVTWKVAQVSEESADYQHLEKGRVRKQHCPHGNGRSSPYAGHVPQTAASRYVFVGNL
jgi:hypothetical protein